MFKLLVNMSRVIYFFRGPTRETVLAETNAVNMQGEDVGGKMIVNGTGRSKLGQGRNSWQWTKHDRDQALKGEHLSALCVHYRGDLYFCVHGTPLWDVSSLQLKKNELLLN